MKRRKQIRLSQYDYTSAGYYFITICIQKRECLLGNISGNKMVTNTAGKMVDAKIREIGKYSGADIDAYCVMPNHIHMILIIVGAGPRARPIKSGSTQGSTPTLGEFVKRFKTLTTNIYTKNVRQKNWPIFNKRLWQRNYYERIIRDEKELDRIRRYISNNPQTWARDKNNPANVEL